MATQLQIRRGTNTQNASFTGAEGELSANTTNDSVHVHDGSTAGGFELARADLNNVSDTDLNAALTGNTVSALTITTLTLGSTAITATGAELNILDGVTATATELNILDGVTATTAELNYVDGVTSAIQTQLDAKAPLANPTFTGSFTSPGIDDNANAIAITIDSSEQVGIGETAPDNLLHVKKASFAGTYGTDASDIFIVENSGTALIDVRSGTGDAGGIQFSDTARGAGAIYYYHSIDQMYFNTASNSGRMILNGSGDLTIVGALSKGSGSFKIDHPLPAKADTHYLVHSFVEAPQADNIYRGSVDLVSGSATVNIDAAAGMTDGTFVLLNTNVQCFTSNESGWTAIKGSVSGNTLTITAQDSACTDTISWMVVGERQDQHMIDTDWTDDNGKVIVEPLKPEEPELP